MGRVVVDSTWHHWFDVNLSGRDFPRISVDDPRKLSGFNATASGQKAYSKIKNYFRNVAIWLSPPRKQKAMACVGSWNCLYRYPLYADLRPTMNVWELGFHAINVMSKYAGACQVRSWWTHFVPHKSLMRLYNDRLTKVPIESLDNIDEFMIGGIMKSLLQQKEDFVIDKIKIPGDKPLEKLILKGLNIGINDFNNHLKKRSLAEKNFKSSLKQISSLI